MKRNLTVFILALLAAFLTMQCSKKGRSVIEPDFGTYSFSTFTVDSFYFRVILNGVPLTDSLPSPIGSFSKVVSFFNTNGRLQIIDARNNNQLVLDTIIKMQTGISNFPLVQLLSGQKPYIPGPPPNEPPPAAGNYKVRFQYVKPESGTAIPYFEPVKCVVLSTNNTANSFVSIDTVLLNKGGITRFYEAPSDKRFRIKLLQPNNSVITSPTSQIESLGSSPSGFNTAIMIGTGGTTSPYTFNVKKVY